MIYPPTERDRLIGEFLRARQSQERKERRKAKQRVAKAQQRADDERQRIQEGERLRDHGIARASRGHYRQRLDTTIAFLEASLRSSDATATSDLATSTPSDAYADGGKWRGGVFVTLRNDGVIEPVGFEQSTRPSRHRGPVMRWRLCDRELAKVMLEAMKRLRDSLPPDDDSAASSPAAIPTDPTPNETSVTAATVTPELEAH